MSRVSRGMGPKKPTTKGEYIACMVLCLLVGTFLIGWNQYRMGYVEPDEAVSVTAALKDVKAEYGKRHSLKGIELRFADHEPLYIESTLATEPLAQELSACPAGTEAQLLVHPRSNMILALTAEGRPFLRYESAMEALASKAKLCAGLGALLYAAAGWIAYRHFIKKAWKGRRKSVRPRRPNGRENA